MIQNITGVMFFSFILSVEKIRYFVKRTLIQQRHKPINKSRKKKNKQKQRFQDSLLQI